jgi:hypothetical protein
MKNSVENKNFFIKSSYVNIISFKINKVNETFHCICGNYCQNYLKINYFFKWIYKMY